MPRRRGVGLGRKEVRCFKAPCVNQSRLGTTLWPSVEGLKSARANHGARLEPVCPGGRPDGPQFGDGIWPHVVLAPGTLQLALAEATNPLRAHISSREIMRVFFMTISNRSKAASTLWRPPGDIGHFGYFSQCNCVRITARRKTARASPEAPRRAGPDDRQDNVPS